MELRATFPGNHPDTRTPPAGPPSPPHPKSRMQFDYLNIQQSLETLQFKQSDFNI